MIKNKVKLKSILIFLKKKSKFRNSFKKFKISVKKMRIHLNKMMYFWI